ncbi:MAG: hypothetical protein A3H91_15870 [Gammaproteobacteria bacterium RIFCSPLOWO2_02_FULL_61_13]|nr:MAG: hypothetical protein A3H91_15870 [Gammaproteobacteria bacterium RIFCSPLOWO2_02_FULL_61_13]
MSNRAPEQGQYQRHRAGQYGIRFPTLAGLLYQAGLEDIRIHILLMGTVMLKVTRKMHAFRFRCGMGRDMVMHVKVQPCDPQAEHRQDQVNEYE